MESQQVEVKQEYGICLILKYVAPRKRKATNWTASGLSIDEVLQKARKWVGENGGRFLKGAFIACRFHNSELSDGRVIRMSTVGWIRPSIALTVEQLTSINK